MFVTFVCQIFCHTQLDSLNVSDFYNAAVDIVRAGQTPQPPGGAEGGGGGSSGWKPGRHDGDAEEDSTGQRSFEGNTEVKLHIGYEASKMLKAAV